MKNKKIINKLNYLQKKICKGFISISLLLSSCTGLSLITPTIAKAEDVKQTFYIEKVDGVGSIGQYFGVDGTKITGHVIKGEDDSIAYCLAHGLKFPSDSFSDNPTIYSKSVDDTKEWNWYLSQNRQPTQAQAKLVQRVLFAGYPTKSPSELGILSNSERAAYYATQVAVWTVLEGWGNRVYKLEGANAEENQMIDEMFSAYQKIMNFAYSDDLGFSDKIIITNTSDRNQINSLKLKTSSDSSLKESELLTVRPAQNDAYATDDKLGLSFSVGFDGDVPEGAKIVDSKGNECYDFGQGTANGTTFRVVLPSNTSYNGTFNVVVSGSFVRNAPVIWNTANTAYQTLMQFGAVQSSSETELSITETGNASGTLTINKLAQMPAGYDSVFSDDTYPDGSGNESALLMHNIKYSYQPLAGVEFALYYKNEGGSHFADELAKRGTTNSDGKIVFTGITLDSDKASTEFYLKELKAPAGVQLDTDKKYDVTLTKDASGNANQSITVKNDAVKAYLTLNKMIEILNSNTAQKAPAGIQFGVYTNESALGMAKDTLINIVETDTNGVINTGNLPLNVGYYLKELKTIDNYAIDSNKYTFNLVANSLLANSITPLHFYQVNTPDGKTIESITNSIQKLNLLVKKNIQTVTDDGTIGVRSITEDESSQFGFSVYSDENLENKIGDMTYDKTLGGYVLGDLDYTKDYFVKETKSSSIYKENTTVLKMNSTDNTKTVVNELSLGSIEITKYNKDTNDVMNNIEFVLSGTNTDGKTLISKTLKTNSNGIVKFDNLPAGLKYTVKETVPQGYKNITGDIVADFTDKADNIQKDVFNQEIVTDININVIKTNLDETIYLENVEFELYKKSDMNTVIATASTDKNGELRFNKLQKDIYVLKEVSTNSHYELPIGDDALTTVDLTGVDDVHTQVVKIKNKAIPLSINVLKVNGAKSAFNYSATIMSAINEGETVAKDVEFKLYKVDAGVLTLIDTLKTDENGKLTFKNEKIIYGGTYLLKETPVDGYKPLDDLTFTIANDITGENVYIKAVNEIFNGELIVNKKDNITSNPIPNVEFKLYLDKTLIDTKKTDENGIIKFSNLKAGSYSIIESKEADGYIKDATAKTFVLNTQNPIQNIEITNKRKPITINILKTIGDEEKVTIDKSNTPIVVDSKDVILDNVKFGLYDNDKLIVEGVTKDGKITFASDNLVVGKEYVLKEIKTPNGYKTIDDLKLSINMNEANTYSMINVKVQNKLIKNVVEVLKVDNITNEKLKGAEFTLYRSANSTDISDIVATAVTNDKGIAIFEGIANGSYYVGETQPPVGYTLNNSERTLVIFDKSEYEVKQVIVSNSRKTIDMTIVKEDRETKDLLQNAGFELYKVIDGKEILVSDNITNKDGKIVFNNIEVGYMYKLVESRVPDGYAKPIKNFVYIDVPLDTESSMLTMTIENDKVKAEDPSYSKIKIVKVDADDNKLKLANAEFEIYKIVNDKEIYIDKGVTDKNGEFTSINLDKGYIYKLVETKTPDGYSNNGKPIFVTIDKNSKDLIIETIVENKKITDSVNLNIIKVDSDDNKVKLADAEFSIYHKEEDNKISLIAKGKTNEKGELLINGLKKGETYTILETNPPKDYEIKGLASQDVTIDKNEKESVINVTIENTKISSNAPQTNDIDKNVPFIIAGSIATIALVGGVIYFVKKKKD